MENITMKEFIEGQLKANNYDIQKTATVTQISIDQINKYIESFDIKIPEVAINPAANMVLPDTNEFFCKLQSYLAGFFLTTATILSGDWIEVNSSNVEVMSFLSTEYNSPLVQYMNKKTKMYKLKLLCPMVKQIYRKDISMRCIPTYIIPYVYTGIFVRGLFDAIGDVRGLEFERPGDTRKPRDMEFHFKCTMELAYSLQYLLKSININANITQPDATSDTLTFAVRIRSKNDISNLFGFMYTDRFFLPSPSIYDKARSLYEKCISERLTNTTVRNAKYTIAYADEYCRGFNNVKPFIINNYY